MTVRNMITEFWKKSADPRYPGLGKNPVLGFLAGFLLGAIGVGLYLRSWTDGLLSAAGCLMLGLLWDSWATSLLCWVICGCWVSLRIRGSTMRHESLQSTGKAPSQTLPESASEESEPGRSAPEATAASCPGV